MTAATAFTVNPKARVHTEVLSSGCPVLVVDDFYQDPMAVRALALQGQFNNTLALYPGLHAQLPPQTVLPLGQTLVQLLAALGSPGCRADDVVSDFSIVTTPAREMLAQQKHPHVDDVPLAGVLYLNPDYEVGTSFFRHQPLDLAFVRDDAEREALGRWMAEHGERCQPQTYAVGDDGVWEHLHTVAGRFNRLVLYPGTAFHSIAMRDVLPNMTLHSARLTQRFFVTRAGHA